MKNLQTLIRKYLPAILTLAIALMVGWPYTIQAADTEVTGTVPLIITVNPSVSNITASGATVTWTTNGSSSSTVYYKKSSDTVYSSQTGTNGPNSSVTLSGLSASTSYNYYVMSVLAEQSISTSGAPGAFTTTASSSGGGGSGGGGGGGGGTAPSTTTTVNFKDLQSSAGVITSAVSALSTDGALSLWIPQNTWLLTATGTIGNYITIENIAADKLPPAPEQGNIIGLAYNMGPQGTTFSPAITIKLSYDPTKLPANVKEEDLAIAYWDTATSQWVILPGVAVHPDENTITASLNHFSTYAVIYKPELIKFVMSGLVISPSKVTAGQEVKIQAIIKNEGINAGDYTVNLTIDGQIQGTQNIHMEGQSTQTVDFSYKPVTSGTYQVDVNGLTNIFAVDPIAGTDTVKISDLQISPAKVDIGEEVSLSALLTNQGDYSTTYKIDLKINDSITDSRKILLSGKSQQEVHFTAIRKIPGTYKVDIAGLTGAFEVRQPPTAATFNLTNFQLSEAQIAPGRQVVVSVLVSNSGDASGTLTLNLKADKEPVETLDVTLPGKSGQTVSFTYIPENEGEVLLEVNELSGKLQVISPPNLIWLLLLVVGLVTVALTVLVMMRRNRKYGYYRK